MLAGAGDDDVQPQPALGAEPHRDLRLLAARRTTPGRELAVRAPVRARASGGSRASTGRRARRVTPSTRSRSSRRRPSAAPASSRARTRRRSSGASTGARTARPRAPPARGRVSASCRAQHAVAADQGRVHHVPLVDGGHAERVVGAPSPCACRGRTASGWSSGRSRSSAFMNGVAGVVVGDRAAQDAGRLAVRRPSRSRRARPVAACRARSRARASPAELKRAARSG